MLAHLLAHAVRIETSWHASARARNMIATSDSACGQMHAIMLATMMLTKRTLMLLTVIAISFNRGGAGP